MVKVVNGLDDFYFRCNCKCSIEYSNYTVYLKPAHRLGRFLLVFSRGVVEFPSQLLKIKI